MSLSKPFFPVVYFDLGDTLVLQKAPATPVPNAINTLIKIAQAGCRLGILSNTGTLTRAEVVALLPPDFPWEKFDSDLIILSSEVGMEKPDAKIFQKAIALTKIPAENILFCTEDLRDALVAQLSGMRTARLLPASVGSDIDTLPKLLAVLAEIS